MRVLILIALVALACAVSSSPIDRKRQLINRPPKDLMLLRTIRSEDHVKGYRRRFQVKGGTQKPELSLRKGEYMCGDRVCRLGPGEMPPGCNGVCQYPIMAQLPDFNTRV
ncbi:uncharacterized protein LOC126376741 [Pectinophora gossypiella]|uniref:uncharacterized protein LOC126376741 n=1 Tax=Pectinophora gossypiella TaxID=13191 RepID=UPI00214EECCA|nr:uncharacterized protein LOC126376741 [Pectinophora gossypiella]